jgi:hypothetical protein
VELENIASIDLDFFCKISDRANGNKCDRFFLEMKEVEEYRSSLTPPELIKETDKCGISKALNRL